MRVVLIQEGVCTPFDTWPMRIKDMLAEAALADQAGFDAYALSEQHFAHGEAITSAPEIFLPAVAAVTRNIRLRIASVNMLPYNHPLRVVEQIAMLDLLSEGRAELGGARSNNPYTLDGFGVSANETASYRDEHLNIIGQAFRQGFVDYDSPFYKIPKRTISPWPKGRRAPPLHLSSSSPESHHGAALVGAGAMTGFGIAGWGYVKACADSYKTSIASAKPVTGSVTNRLGLFSVGVSCAKDRATARSLTKTNTLRFIEVILDFFLKLAERSPDYQYMGKLKEIAAHRTDLDFLIEETPYVVSGSPEDVIASARKAYDLGYDDLIWRIDGMGHRDNMASIEMIGKHVLPTIHAWPEHANASPASNWSRIDAQGA